MRIPDNNRLEDKLYSVTLEERGKIEDQIKKATLSYLGSAFEIQSKTYHRGSLEILIVVGTVYYAISRYK